MSKFFGTTKFTNDGWVTLEVEHEVGRYLRKLYSYYCHNVQKLKRPARSEHITIASANEKPVLNPVVEGRILGFSLLYDTIGFNGNAVWLLVYSPEIEKYRRKRLKINTELEKPLHLCVGYINEGKNYE